MMVAFKAHLLGYGSAMSAACSPPALRRMRFQLMQPSAVCRPVPDAVLPCLFSPYFSILILPDTLISMI